MGFEPVYPSPGGEEQQVGMSGGVDEVSHRILVLELCSCYSLATTPLGPKLTD